MSQDPMPSKKPMPYLEMRQVFSEARHAQLNRQGEITNQVIKTLQESRKYARSKPLPMIRD